MTTYFTYIESPVGPLFVTSDGAAITRLEMDGQKTRIAVGPDWVQNEAPFTGVRDQLAEYFTGTLHEFDLPLAPAGTQFQRRVWDALLQVPFGATVSYSHIAHAIGSPKACRAVGLANGQNPIAIIIPCHRVIGANGKLTGYGGGLDRKEWLLNHEMARSMRESGISQITATTT